MITVGQADLVRGLAKNEFAKGLAMPPAGMLHPILSTPVQSDRDQETYAWLGQVPQLVAWKGLRQITGLPVQSFVIPNLSFEATLGFESDLIERDKLGQVQQRSRDLGVRVALHRDRLLIDRLIQGATTNAYDGQYFFDTDHADPGSVYTTSQSNTVSTAAATGTLPTPAEAEAAIDAALNTRLRVVKDDGGEPFNVMEDLHVIVSPAMEKSFRIALDPNAGTNAADSTGVTGAFRGAAKLHVSPWLPARQSALGATVDNKAFLFNVGGSVHPFILQIEKEPEFTTLGFGSEHEFKTRTHLVGVFTKYNVGYGPWQHAVEMIFT